MARNKAVWLAGLLFRRGHLSREEIFAAWADVDERGRRMAPSTFYDNRNLLLSRYGISIRSDHGLYSLDIGGSRERAFLESLLGSEEQEQSSAGIIAEQRPAGTEWVAELSRAMERSTAVEMRYAPFDKPEYSTTLSPYCLRVFRSRLYCVGYSSHHGSIRTFALDRIAALKPTSAPQHRRGDFNARRYFAHSFGIYGGDSLSVEHVVLLADERSAAFLRSLPLHSSQREQKPTATGERYTTAFSLDISVTDDFVRELLYYASGILVKSPRSLARRIEAEARAVAEAYRRP